jgi:predicted dehydrogenase
MIIAAVAARDKKKAEAYAKKWKIPIVHETYDGKFNS